MYDFYAYQIILGRRTFAQCPMYLREGVRESLIASGMGHLVTE